MTGYGNGLIAMYNIKKKEFITNSKEHKQSITGFALIKAGLQFASSSYDGTVIVWRIDSKSNEKLTIINRISDIAPILTVACPTIR